MGSISCIRDRFHVINPHGDVVEPHTTEDSQVELATNGIPTEYALRHEITIDPVPEHMLPKPTEETSKPTEDASEPIEDISGPSASPPGTPLEEKGMYSQFGCSISHI